MGLLRDIVDLFEKASTIHSKILTTDKDLLEFQAIANKKVRVDFSIDYFKQGIVRGIYFQGKLIGGYAFIKSGPLRTFLSIPKDFKVKVNKEDFFEVTALWLDREIKFGLLSAYFWFKFSRDIYNQKDKKYYIYAYDLKYKKLGELYQLARPTILYRGKVEQLPGNKSEAFESVEMAKRTTIGYLPIYGIHNILIKIFFNRRTYIRDVVTKQSNKA